MVIKYSGNAMTDPALQADFAEDVVHGGGPQIETALKRLGKKGEFIQGMRVTGAETMEVVDWMLAGEIQLDHTHGNALDHQVQSGRVRLVPGLEIDDERRETHLLRGRQPLTGQSNELPVKSARICLALKIHEGCRR